MTVSSFGFRAEFDYYASVLVIDEVGEHATVLIDKLITHDCLVNYYGKESPESFSSLSGKNGFRQLASFSEIEQLKKIDYLFYFPSPIKRGNFAENIFSGALIREADFFHLTQDHACKILLCCSINSRATGEYQQLVKEKRLNARLVVFDELFGPRVKNGLLGELLRSAMTGRQATLSRSAEETIFLLSAETLAEKLIGLTFSPLTKGKSYFLWSRQMRMGELVERVKINFPGLVVDYLGSSERKGVVEGWEELTVEENWEEEINKAVTWLQSNLPLPPPRPQDLPLTEVSPPEEPFEFSRLELPQLPREETRITEEVEKKEKKTEERKEPVEESVVVPQFLKESQLKPGQPEEKRVKKDKKEKKAVLNPRPASSSRKFFFGFSIFASLLFVFFALPLLLIGSFGLLGLRELEGTRQAVGQGNFSLAIKKNTASERFLSFSQRLLLTTSPFYALVGMDKPVGAINGVFQLTQNVNEALGFSLLASQDFFKWANGFLAGTGGSQPEDLSSIKTNLASAYERASLAQSTLPAAEAGFKYLRQTDQLEKLKNYLPESREVLIKGQTLLSVFPKILSFSGRKTYLVLFQNNAELRPTGGFIGSFAVVNLENGKLVNFEVFDVYQADGQLKGHVEPPAKLKEYLGEANWFLRDSNWDPDFAISAQRAEWFLDKEMQMATDGVVAVSLEAARKVVTALGEVEVLDYQEKVNGDNLFQKAEYYSELGTFPGSTQKKDFLGSLFGSLLERVKNSQGKELMEIGEALFQSLEQKEILFYFNDSEVQKVTASLNWGGNIREYQPKAGLVAAFPDYLFINEANVGVNKANFFLQRRIDHQINLNPDGRVEEKLTLTYDNQSPSDNWPAGTYKTYLRLYLPRGTKVTSILATDPKNPSLWLPFEWRYFDIAEEHDKALFGFYFEVPIKVRRVIEIKYELPQKMDFSKKLNAYLLLVQKQPGAHPSDYTLNFTYPENFIPVRVIPSAIVGQEQLLTNSKLIKDLIFQLDLAH